MMSFRRIMHRVHLAGLPVFRTVRRGDGRPASAALRHGAAPPRASGDGQVVPRVVWLLWLQGWDRAPELVRACAETWRRLNPGWQVRLLDHAALADVLPGDDLAHVAGKLLEPEAFSDVVRLELLARYGGVWADATTYCLRPLDQWLPARMGAGFFAFARPVPERLLSSWFLAAVPGNGIAQAWRSAARDYWASRTSRDDYFWVHHLFGAMHASDPGFRAAWDAVPALSAEGPHWFAPYEPRLAAPPTVADDRLLAEGAVPVLKLTHKGQSAESAAGSAARRLCDMARGLPRADRAPPRPEVLVAWYGSFRGHGTIGDRLSLESVVARLAVEGWRVAHASADPVEMPGATRVDWAQVDPRRFAAVVFVCGPIIAGHPQTEALFARFRGRPLLGVGVSLFDAAHDMHADPFSAVLARQGRAERFEDVAIIAPPPPLPRRDRAGGLVVGLALRGPQAEYGADNCLWERTERLARVAAEEVLRPAGGRVASIENHLGRSGLDPREIEARYAACDLVITSRFHGAMLALRHRIPFVAIDQIRGGGKVEPLLAGRGWPHVLRADAAEERDVVRAATAALAGTSRPLLEAFRDRAVAGANVTLAAMTSWLASRCEPCLRQRAAA